LAPVSLPSGDVAKITVTGSIQFNNSFQLNNVLCVPSFKVDLMSVGKTTDDLHAQ
jgi:malic enzyme